MKRKLIIPIVLCLFAGLTVFNIGLANRPTSTDTTLDLISVMVKAFDEGEGGDPITATCYWTYERLWPFNSLNFIRCTTCQEYNAFRIWNTGECNYTGGPE